MEKVALLFVLCLSCVLVFGQNDRTTTPSCRKDQTLVCTNPCTTVPTCQNPNATRETLISCGGLCLHACVCDAKQGLILDENTQKCVKKEDCPPGGCGPNEHYGCGPCPCPERTCQVPNPKCPKYVCPIACVRVCACDPGYLRDTTTKQCVPRSSCPKRGD
ncbi:inducible metalloproteinase inhibitor protein isoform X1 [Diabrotica virgifera virgifera]|uniref:Inducible metalloproteinase inhibitor protein isoform X1 n=1 Tax=Diabrotica virgifera virgifera TaxID=50390 RepID=A0A6P7G304_DIAVI|nr:inducible metalloproteinase inhibitor protein isoform X1 [Diabrotica virgifera virgifera]